MPSTGLFLDDAEHRFRRVSLPTGSSHDERWWQDLLFRHPDLIPIDEIDPGARQLIPLCRELPLPRESGNVFLDLLGITAAGRLVLIECKLWRNPQARREVIGQILEYAALLRRWSYADLIAALRRKLPPTGVNPLFDLIRPHNPELGEADLADRVSRSLSAGDFDLVIVGDGIRADLHAIASHLDTRSGHGGRLALVELQLWEDGIGRRLVIPLLPFRTHVVEHRLLTDHAGLPLRSQPIIDDTEDLRQSASEDIADPERPSSADRVFWQRFVDETAAGFDHPDQTPARHGGRNWVRLDLPAPLGWLTVYRTSRGYYGFFLSLTGDAGRKAWTSFQMDRFELERDIDGPAFSFRIKNEEPFVGVMDAKTRLDDMDDDARRRWLLQRTNRLVTALRTRLSLISP